MKNILIILALTFTYSLSFAEANNTNSENEWVFIDSEVIESIMEVDQKIIEKTDQDIADSLTDADKKEMKDRYHHCIRRLCLPSVSAFQFQACSKHCKKHYNKKKN